MSAKIIVIANQKGGVGKTSLTMTLAATLAHKKNKVLVVDADVQGTASKWAATTPEDEDFPATVISLSEAGTKIHRELKRFVDDYHYLLVDCPPAADSPVAQSALLVADITLIPVIPSPPDIWAALNIRKAIEHAQTINEELKSLIVINQHLPNTNLSKSVLEVLPEFGLPIAKSMVGQRTAFRESAALGLYVQALGIKGKKATQELENLVEEVLIMLR